MRHIINRQVIDMRTNNGLDSFALQQKISDIYYDDMLPLLEKLFDELSNEDELISLDCLEIDLGIFTEKELYQKDQLEKILSSIRRQVSEKLRPAGSTSKSSLQIGKWSLNVFRQWIYYMRNGYLPWNSPIPDENWLQKVLEAGATDHQSIELLRQLIRTDENALKRIIFQHSPIYLSHILELLTSRNQSELPLAMHELSILLNEPGKKNRSLAAPSEKQLPLALWIESLLMTTRVNDPSVLTATQIILRLLFLNLHNSQIKKIVTPGFLLKSKIRSSIIAEAIEQLKTVTWQQQESDEFPSKEKWAASLMDPSADDLKIENSNPAHEIKISITNPQANENFPTETKSTTEQSQKPVDRVNEDGIIVQQAGIVLLHPFLNLFFRDRQLVNDGKFIGPIEKLKALGLLYYLATGDTIIPEYQLVVAKTICDHPLEEAVPARIELTEEDLVSADDLLREVVAQWSILKNTGIQTLREEFLKRNGKLSFKDEAHMLQIETRSIDLLLEHLPWPMSFIKLPWMKTVMKIVWR